MAAHAPTRTLPDSRPTEVRFPANRDIFQRLPTLLGHDRRAEHLKARKNAISSDDDQPLAMAQAINTVRSDRSYRQAAHQIATEMAAAPTIDELLTDLLAH